LLTVSDSTVINNQAVGGAGGAAGAGGIAGNGGNGEGGGLFNTATGFSGTGQATLTVSGCSVTTNEAEGGAGASGGSGGNGFGGGLFNDAGATATVRTSVIAGNQADGGAGAGGSAGQGIGGGVYNLGTFDLDAASIIEGNDASTSNDDVFGPITPI
jgi:hypothetical protein